MPSKVKSKRKHPPIAIEASHVKHNSTCVSLRLPIPLACAECTPEIDVHSHTRTKKKRKDRSVIDDDVSNIGILNG